MDLWHIEIFCQYLRFHSKLLKSIWVVISFNWFIIVLLASFKVGYSNLSRWHQNVWTCNPMQPNLLSMTKKFLSGISSEYKDLAKFAEDTDSHLIEGGLEDAFQKFEGRHYSLQALNLKTNYPNPSAKQKFHEIPKNDRPTKRRIAGHKGTPQYNSSNTRAELKKQSNRRSQCKNHHKHGRN